MNQQDKTIAVNGSTSPIIDTNNPATNTKTMSPAEATYLHGHIDGRRAGVTSVAEHLAMREAVRDQRVQFLDSLLLDAKAEAEGDARKTDLLDGLESFSIVGMAIGDFDDPEPDDQAAIDDLAFNLECPEEDAALMVAAFRLVVKIEREARQRAEAQRADGQTPRG